MLGGLGARGAVVAMVMYGLVERAKYRLSILERERSPPRELAVQGYRLRGADGSRHPFALVNGRLELARDDVDDLVEEVIDAVGSIQVGQSVDASLGTWHARTLLEVGQPGEDRTRDRIDEHARKLLVDELRPVGSLTDTDDVERACRAVPESAWRGWLDDLRGDVVLDHGETFELVRDPWVTGGRR